VIDLAKHIAADSFFSAQITQIDITTDRKFELTPLIGDHIVRFGEATDIDNKFSRLNAFYRSAWLQHGINTYETIDVQYKNQVVGIKQGTAKAYSDSAAALSLIKNTAMFPPATDTASVKPVSPVLKPARPVLKRKDPVVVKPLAVKTATAKTFTAKPAAVKPAKTAKTLMPKNNKKIQKSLRT
jgi:cell division protein FtsQ